ncbi:MAG TPA: DUF4136 domain-containing protein [Candidatus Acidoferrum sp.]|nr:DUF4136 domain-containing protein [Candidatus Acidoferrum sp.]
MKRIALRVALLLAFAAGRAAAQQASYNFDLDTDFSKFLSYKWVDIKGEQQVDHLTAEQITIVVDAELAKKGLFKTNSDYADLYIGYQTALSRQTPWMAYRDGWGYGPGWGGGLASIAESSVRAGHLDLDIYAAAEKKLVWRGAVSNAFDLGLSLGNSEAKIQKSVEKLLQNYPPNRFAPPSGRQRELNDHRRGAHCFLCNMAPALFHHRAPHDH